MKQDQSKYSQAGLDVVVIVPVFNAEDFLESNIKALAGQDVNNYQVVYVDNNSTDNSLNMIKQASKKHPDIFTFVTESTKGSYAARNTGLKAAPESTLIAFTDADCIPHPNWLRQAVKHFHRNPELDLLAGQVIIRVQQQDDPWQLFDSLYHMDNEVYVLQGKAATANLIANKQLFNKQAVGKFPIVKSGGDAIWVHSAISNGYRLNYGSDVKVNHPARRKKELIVKKRRTGAGQIQVWRSRGLSKFNIFGRILLAAMPPSPFKLWRKFQRRKPELFSILNFIQVYKVAVILRFYAVTALLNSEQN